MTKVLLNDNTVTHTAIITHTEWCRLENNIYFPESKSRVKFFSLKFSEIRVRIIIIITRPEWVNQNVLQFLEATQKSVASHRNEGISRSTLWLVRLCLTQGHRHLWMTHVCLPAPHHPSLHCQLLCMLFLKHYYSSYCFPCWVKLYSRCARARFTCVCMCGFCYCVFTNNLWGWNGQVLVWFCVCGPYNKMLIVSDFFATKKFFFFKKKARSFIHDSYVG